MNIKPNKAGTRDYAKGGAVYDRDIMDPGGSHSPSGLMGPVVNDPGVKNPGGSHLESTDRVSDMSESEWLSMTPDKLYPGTEAARRWKKNSPNG